ncbi:hypothetical protein BGW38_007993 [Lunasporangiospora selenospora]|uniref:Sulfite oxidase n=1 Tax=Lunasporangiospora selenospora TaxID=979761 RepID=A0A9P6FYH1_9FUNG|nr:hypothetical protein BGW38_007993 [Lunasporangiospora selenospora]
MGLPALNNANNEHTSPPEHLRVDEQQLCYSKEPLRDLSHFLVHVEHPLNAEPLLPLLVNAGTITPSDLFFKRNHGPIPNIQLEEHRCAGNRRDGLAQLKEVKGVIWGAGTISTAVWGGPRLRDVLRDIAGIHDNDLVHNYHVAFEADDHVHEDACYGSSIPLRKAMDPLGDVILAYEMNGEPLSRDHGFPLRVIVPGFIGARSVKYLQKIIVQSQESNSYFQQKDYKILPPWVDSHNVDKSWGCAGALGEMNVQCVICTPTEKETILSSRPVVVKGYAISGGGRSIYRVELSVDGGRTWEPVDKIEQAPQKGSGMYWAWALWEKTVSTVNTTTELVARAYDSSGNIQPETPIWNYRGVMNNAWFRVKNVTQMPHHNL